MFRTLHVKNGWSSHTFTFDIFLDLINVCGEGGGKIALYSDVYSKVTTVTVTTASGKYEVSLCMSVELVL